MNTSYQVTGLMSGSSLDGVDLAFCELYNRGTKWEYRIIAAENIPYPADLHSQLLAAHTWTEKELRALDLQMGEFYGQLLSEFHQKHQLKPVLISSHGHTILHEPGKGITLQVGNGQLMADITGTMVIGDFRSQDVMQGGQGAPLAPVGDLLLFSRYESCLNLGGIANISMDDSRGVRMAFDICPVNMVLNWLAGKRGLEMDRDGEIARLGTVDPQLLSTLNSLDFYQTTPPKSLGREWFIQQLIPLLTGSRLSIETLMATSVEHIAIQIDRVIRKYGITSLLVTGGGALNAALIERLRSRTVARVVIPESDLIHFKEALIFALLGVLRFRKEINCIASVTGGRKDLSAGRIFEPGTGQH